jgi:flagellar hook assembly protein FlgD
MKKIMMMIAALAMTVAMQAQSKFHDVEANEAKGAVKSITQDVMGMSTTINFSEDGKMSSTEFSDAVYDSNGYLQSVKRSMQGQSILFKYVWENSRLKGQTFEMMGQEVKSTFNYDDKGIITSSSIDFGGQAMETPYSDYKFDDHGNWISRKTSMMGQEVTVTRSFTYYE